jgi:alpha-D-ribose 1-methylphosphonate 5-triphosphate diphosphatase PhnM
MTNFEQTLLKEVAALPGSRRADVLAFVRYLRISLMDDTEMERQFDAAIKTIRETAKKYNITEKDVEEEVRAVREEHARRA